LPTPRPVTVFNVAMPGITTHTEWQLFEGFSGRLKPEVVVLAYMVNDVGDSARWKVIVHPGLIPWRPVTEASAFIEFVVWRAYSAWFRPDRNDLPCELAYFQDPEVFARHATYLDGLVTSVRQRGASMVAVLYPFLGIPTEDGPQRFALQKVRTVLEQRGVPVIDVTEILDTTDTRYMVNAFDPHPNALLNRLVAPVLADCIAEVLAEEPVRLETDLPTEIEEKR